MLKKLSFIFLLSLLVSKLNAQTDVEFWFVAPDVSYSHGLNTSNADTSKWTYGDRPAYIVLTALSFPSTVYIEQPANSAFKRIRIDLPSNATVQYDLSKYIDEIENRLSKNYNGHWGYNNKGIYITATAPITAYYDVSGPKNPDLFSLKGANALGNEFYTIFQTDNSNGYSDSYSAFHIVATTDSTIVEITPTVALVGDTMHIAGKVFSILLNKGETFIGAPFGGFSTYGNPVISSAANMHPNGTHIKSNKPIAVTLHDCSVSIGSCKDLRGDQMIPVNLTGREYVAIKGKGGVYNGVSAEKVYVTSLVENEHIEVNGVLAAVIGKGQPYGIDIVDPILYIKSRDSTIYVMQISGEGCEVGQAILPPIDFCSGSTEVNFTRSATYKFYLNILVRSGAQNNFLLNGVASPKLAGSLFKPVPGRPEWMAISAEFSNTEIPTLKAAKITNTKDLFHLGIISSNGGSKADGTRFGYFSNFNKFRTKVINTKNGKQSLHACYKEPTIYWASGGLSEGSSTNLTYKWNTGANTPYIEIIPTHDENFYVTVTLNNGCNISSIDSGMLTVNPEIIANSSASLNLVCEKQAVTLNATGSINYRWNTGDSTATAIIRPRISKLYIVTVSDAVGCGVTSSVQVNVNAMPVLALADTINFCIGDSALIDTKESILHHYLWQDGPGGPSRIENMSGLYSVTVTDAKGCSNSDTTLLVNRPLPVIFKSVDTNICKGEPIMLHASGGSTYKWSNGNTVASFTISPFIDTKYVVTVSSKYLCKNTDSVKVHLWTLPIANAGADQNICRNDSTIITATGGITYNWNNGINAAANKIAPQTLTSYHVLVIDVNGCKKSDTMNVGVYTLPTFSLSKPDTVKVCPDVSVALNPSVSNAINFVWNNGATSANISAKFAGKYKLIVADAHLCKWKDSIFIYHYPAPTANAGIYNGICLGDQITLTANGGNRYTWSNGASTYSTNVKPAASTNYYVSVYNVHNCSDTATAKIIVHALPIPNIIGIDSAYIGNMSSFFTASHSGNIYQWNVEKGIITNGNGSNTINTLWNTSTAGKIKIKVDETLSNIGCTGHAEKIITLFAPPKLSMNKKDISCYQMNDGFAEGFVSGGIGIPTYYWDNGITSHSISQLQEGTYHLTICDNNHYCDSESVDILRPDPLLFDIIVKNDNPCYGDQQGSINIVTTGGTAPINYFINGASTNNMMDRLQAGRYFLVIKDKENCSIDTSITITQAEKIQLWLTASAPYCPQTSDGGLTIHATGGSPIIDNFDSIYTYTWNDGSVTEKIENLAAGHYSVIVTDKNECSNTIWYNLIAARDLCINVPTVFSPNGDGVNDLWRISNLTNFYPEAEVYVYDRMGVLLSSSKGSDILWDGRRDNRVTHIDSYHYIIEFNDKAGSYQTGQVTLLK